LWATLTPHVLNAAATCVLLPEVAAHSARLQAGITLGPKQDELDANFTTLDELRSCSTEYGVLVNEKPNCRIWFNLIH
jgi:hypothetical protein